MRLPTGLKYFPLILCLSLAACSSLDDEINKDVTASGTVPLDKVRIGSPEMLLKEAKITFAQDDNAQANAGGKRQYLSREKTPAGGQYIVQCIDNNVFEIDVNYKPGSITRQAAEDLAAKLLPADAPIKLGVETIRMDNRATARINYADSPAASPVPGGVTGGAGNAESPLAYRVEFDLTGPKQDGQVDFVRAVYLNNKLAADARKKAEMARRAELIKQVKGAGESFSPER